MVVRETDGTLRTATVEEHDRMNRTYFAQPERPVNEPALFKNPSLKVICLLSAQLCHSSINSYLGMCR